MDLSDEGLVEEINWRVAYTQLLKQFREMQQQLTRAQDEARAVRAHAAEQHARLRSIRTERRASDRLPKITEPEEFLAYRTRRKKRGT